MKKIISLVLVCILVLTACSSAAETNVSDVDLSSAQEQDGDVAKSETQTVTDSTDIVFKGLDDVRLLRYVEEDMYTNLIAAFNSDEYFVEHIEATYYPKEYIEALSSNSKENKYFGYMATELETQFQGTKYVFTLGEDGKTRVVPMETVNDDIFVKALEDAIVGAGVIMICVTISLVSAPAAPAVSMIFAASATTGTSFAMESSAMSFVAAAIAKGYETESFEQAVIAGVEASGEGFKWGAITGTIMGGAEKAIALKGATINGITMNEAAKIQRETKWPLDVIKAIHSYDEFLIYKKAGNYPTKLSSGEWAFDRKINWSLVDGRGRTNVERVSRWGVAPIDEMGRSYELHHIGQKANSPLAILTWDEHHSKDNFLILHYQEEGKNVAADIWEDQKREFWKEILNNAILRGEAKV